MKCSIFSNSLKKLAARFYHAPQAEQPNAAADKEYGLMAE